MQVRTCGFAPEPQAVVYAGAVDAFTNQAIPINLQFIIAGVAGKSSSMGMISLIASRKVANGMSNSVETASRAVFAQVCAY